MDVHLQQLVLERLTADDDVGERAADLVLAACEGPAELELALAGATGARTAADAQLELPENPPGAYLASIGVEGFRGVGPAARLELTPGPGLTLVVGRNGSGKSSFAEGLELLMTGTNSRWVDRTKVWTEGWQNLHHDADTTLTAELHVDGEPGTLTLRRSWPKHSTLSPGTCAARRADGSAVTLDELGWSAALSRYRPFLSYNELGQMFDELRTMYDALAAILGLEDVEALQNLLRDARLARDRAQKELKAQVKDLVQRLRDVDDERAAAVVAALEAKPPDLDTVELSLAGLADGRNPAAETATLQQLCALAVPAGDDVRATLDRLAAARERMGRFEGTDAARASSLARLLETALRHDEAHKDPDCPVCGTGGVIDDQWRLATSREIVRLSQEARDVEAARTEVSAAERRVADLLAPDAPPVVGRARDLGLDPAPVEDAWADWREVRARAADPDSAQEIAAVLGALERRVEALSGAAQVELERREDLWRPEARRLSEWLPRARAAIAAGEGLAELKEAEEWVKRTAADLQAQRLEPISGAAKHNWERLRQDSNVSLDGFHLRKKGNVRSAEVEVKVDGSDASAFGVMSQGELHALAVSVFLPRAALPESPFRFMVIDDPVQSMDPSKVDGLARVLDEAAATRQVVVFTHDERLPEAVRRLGIEATVREVTRRPGSVVEVRVALDPIDRYLEDARMLVRSEQVPREVIDRVVPGFCRHAIEAACAEVVRRRRLARGEPHAEVEAALQAATTLYMRLALALFDDASRSGDVLARVNARYGKKHGDVVVGANKGVHELLDADLRDFIRDAGIFSRELAGAS